MLIGVWFTWQDFNSLIQYEVDGKQFGLNIVPTIHKKRINHIEMNQERTTCKQELKRNWTGFNLKLD